MVRGWTCVGIAALLGLLLGAPVAARADAGDIDLTFGQAGVVFIDFNLYYDLSRTVAVQPDGRLVVGGDGWVNSTARYHFGLVRLMPDGSLDPSFGDGGRVITQMGSLSTASKVLLQPDGKVVAGGAAWFTNYYRFAVVRWLADGTLDPTFGTGGIVTTDIGADHDGAGDLVLQPDGKLVAFGYRVDPPVAGGSVRSWALVRYNPDGTLDPTFGSGGIVITKHGPLGDSLHAGALQPDGRIIAVGESNPGGGGNDVALARYLPNGSLDPSFGTGGKVVTQTPLVTELGNDVVLQPDGKIVVAGSAKINNVFHMALTRYMPNGALDTSFGVGGRVTISPGGLALAQTILRQADGKLVVAGQGKLGASNEYCIARFLPDGTLDPTFGNGGVTYVVMSTVDDIPYDIAAQADGSIVVVGQSYTDAAWYDFGITRLLAGAICGNGLLEDGEQCEDGNTQNGDCCSSSCQLDGVGASCADDGNPCTADVCGAANTCEHPVGPAGVTCRPANGACDVAEVCDGLSSACPADGLAAEGTTCRAAAGPCDVADSCTGSSSACPTDAFQPSGTTCRTSAGVCDLAEVCAGTGSACPSDVKSTATCRPASDVCDVAESCNGSDDDCPADAFAPASTVCRSVTGECDVAESCSGTGPGCPQDSFAPAESACADDGETCTRDVCNGSGPGCQHPAGNAGTSCRPGSGACDSAEACDGVAPTCPADGFLPTTTVCRASAGDCDAPELCPGTGVACPADAKLGGVCRPEAGICDTVEWCDGSTNDCPADTFVPSSVTCRTSSGECDVAETCTGSGADCPADAFMQADTPCSSDGEACTRDVCGGASPACQHPAGNAGTICRAASGACDAAETCNGIVPTCPADGGLPDGDADGLCDAVDPCTNVGGGRTFVLTNPVPKIVLTRINTDTTPGNDHLTVAGAFYLPIGRSFADLNPLALGARIVIVNRLAGTELDVNVPPGAQTGTGTRGWKLTNEGKTWTFTDPTSTPAGAIVKVQLFDRSATAARRVEVSIVGDDGTYPVVAGDEPIDVSIAIGGQAEAAAGLCAESDFVAADCFYNASRNQLTCRK